MYQLTIGVQWIRRFDRWRVRRDESGNVLPTNDGAGKATIGVEPHYLFGTGWHRWMLIPLLALLISGTTGSAAAVDAEEAAGVDLRLAGYPAFTITISDEAITAPAQAPAGRILMIEENIGGQEAHVAVMRLPDDVADAEINATLAIERETLADVTPEWFYRSTFVGNPDRAAAGGGRAYGLVDFQPGRYMVIDPLHPAKFARFDVIGDAAATPAPAVDLEADVAVEMFEMDFTMPTTVAAGSHVWQVTNVGADLHELAFLPVPAGATVEEFLAAIGSFFAGQPIPADLGPEWSDWQGAIVAGTGVTSPGGTVWGQFDLAPGTYAAVCFVPSGDVPHLMAGMTKIIAVSEIGMAGFAE